MCPIKYGVHSIQNTRPEMEDAHCAKPLLGATGDLSDSARSAGGGATSLGSLSFFAVFDGHGGARAAEFSGERLERILSEDREILLSDPREALRRAFAKTEQEWHTLAIAEELMDGTTAAVVLFDKSAKRCVVGNIGDSEVLLGTRRKSGEHEFVCLTEVHHLKRNPSEADRISKVGGRIWKGRLGHPRINPMVISLSVSRAIGDVFFKDARYTHGQESGLVADPWITTVDVCGEDVVEQFLVVGCDGLWDTVSYQEVSNFVFQQLRSGVDPQLISEGLVNLASDAGSSDNITAIVVLLVY